MIKLRGKNERYRKGVTTLKEDVKKLVDEKDEEVLKTIIDEIQTDVSKAVA